MAKIKNIEGSKFGRLTAVKPVGKKGAYTLWECSCDCGNSLSVTINNLCSGHTKSCGCLSIDMLISRSEKHGNAKRSGSSKEYASWASMKSRCLVASNKAYKNYGGRGIKICSRWLGEDGFSNFLLDMGAAPSSRHSLDRYPNNDGDYEPVNCRWGTKKEQADGRRSSIWIVFRGERMVLIDWAKRLNVDSRLLTYYMRKHSFEKAYYRYLKPDFINHTFSHFI